MSSETLHSFVPEVSLASPLFPKIHKYVFLGPVCKVVTTSVSSISIRPSPSYLSISWKAPLYLTRSQLASSTTTKVSSPSFSPSKNYISKIFLIWVGEVFSMTPPGYLRERTCLPPMRILFVVLETIIL